MNHSLKTISNSITWVLLLSLVTLGLGNSVTRGQSQDATNTDASQVAEEESAPEDESAANAEEEIEEPPYTPKSKSELQKSLTSLQYKVTQNSDTEPAFRNKYWDNKKPGLYRCIVCGQSLFSSDTKYKSGTGWPSFYDPIKKNHVGYKTERFFFTTRTEVHCSRCKAHLGHVFDDGPKEKTGMRYCMNSASLRFEPQSETDKQAPDQPAESSLSEL